MNAELIYGILFLAVITIIIGAGGIYMWLTRKKSVKKAPPAAAAVFTPERGGHKPGKVYVPPEVPRTVGTIKEMAREDPKLIENVLREWIKGEIATDVTKDSEKKKK